MLLQTTEKMVSGRVAEGSTVRYRVARDIVGPGGNILIAYGSFAQGRVTRSRPRGMFGKAGQLEFTVDTVGAVDGTAVPLRAQQEVAGKGNKNEVIISTLLLSVLAVFVHGRDVEVRAGTEITAYVDHDTVIQHPQPAAESGVVRGEPVEAVSIAEPADGASVRAGQQVRVVVEVTPSQKFRSLALFCDGKQIATQDGKLEAVTWSTRGLAAGEHVLEAEVRFTNGRVMRSAPVTVRIVP